MALLLNAGDTVSRSYSYTQPSPLHPSQPEGTGERTGNLADVIRGKVPRIADGSLVTFEGLTTEYVPFHTGDILSITFEKPFQTKRFYVFYYIGDTLLVNKDLAYGTAITSYAVPETVDRIRIRIDYSGVEVSNVMLNTGSTPLPYEPYGYKIPISSANTTTPVYLGEVQSTRRIKKLVLSSSQDWRLQSINSYGIANFYFITTNDFIDNTSIISNYFTRQTTTITNTTDEGMLIALSINATVYIRIKTQTASTVQEFKDWLDGLSEEVAIWYVLATEETGIVNEPIRKIGDYADEVSGITIPTIAGANTLSVDTTLQPSEVSVNYKGWHPVQSVHERENGAWT